MELQRQNAQPETIVQLAVVQRLTLEAELCAMKPVFGTKSHAQQAQYAQLLAQLLQPNLW